MSNCSSVDDCPGGNCVGCKNGTIYCNDPRCYPNCTGCNNSSSNYNWIISTVMLILLVIVLILLFIAGVSWYKDRSKAAEPKNITIHRHLHNVAPVKSEVLISSNEPLVSSNKPKSSLVSSNIVKSNLSLAAPDLEIKPGIEMSEPSILNKSSMNLDKSSMNLDKSSMNLDKSSMSINLDTYGKTYPKVTYDGVNLQIKK